MVLICLRKLWYRLFSGSFIAFISYKICNSSALTVISNQFYASLQIFLFSHKQLISFIKVTSTQQWCQNNTFTKLLQNESINNHKICKMNVNMFIYFIHCTNGKEISSSLCLPDTQSYHLLFYVRSHLQLWEMTKFT